MKRFLGYAQNGSFAVGCTGQTVYILNAVGEELARFRDIRYGYVPLFAPDRNLVVVKSSESGLAVYDLDELKLKVKLTTSGKSSQDEGMCFTPDGKYFLNIEMKSDLTCEIVVYDGVSFEEKRRYHVQEKKVTFSAVECAGEACFVLGYYRDDDGIFDYGFVAKFDGERLTEIKRLTDNCYRDAERYQEMALLGFTPKALEWSNYTIPAKPVLLHELFGEK